ncbi:uncharacterized protein LOC114303024 [Camellia sinensis]|uniref:uncharacterized protein LOC114303024 n=1 Tax=Camellia sinensis TaxID=4442 RepID=UPI00103640EE|nr:uncharacterized protein LOC114303024 [Camellia sinensis]
MSRYTCCGGYMPCSGKCGESKCPEFCLCTEVFLCFANSVASTRFMLQDEFNIQTTPCDNCIIGFMLCLQQLACIFSLVACITGIDELQEASQILSCFSDLVYCTVCACMQTQHKVEMDKRDGKFGPPPVMAVPPAQHMSRIDQGIPPPVGYPAPAYGTVTATVLLQYCYYIVTITATVLTLLLVLLTDMPRTITMISKWLLRHQYEPQTD